jgi:RNA polymerase sigma factor (sigma-70 family)
MEYLEKVLLLDKNGQPLGERIQKALLGLLPRLRRTFSTLTDDTVVTEILEEAGHKVVAHEEEYGPVQSLHAFCWVAVRHGAISRLRRSEGRIDRTTVKAGPEILSRTPSAYGTPEEIERKILFRQLLERLSPQEQMVAIWKRAGVSSRDIARHLGVSESAVNTMHCRIKHKLRKAVR